MFNRFVWNYTNNIPIEGYYRLITRFIDVYRTYIKKSKKYTLSEFITEMDSVVKEMGTLIGGWYA